MNVIQQAYFDATDPLDFRRRLMFRRRLPQAWHFRGCRNKVELPRSLLMQPMRRHSPRVRRTLWPKRFRPNWQDATFGRKARQHVRSIDRRLKQPAHAIASDNTGHEQ